MRAAIVGLSGPKPTAGEGSLFRELEPAGFILFARNCVDPAQLRSLTDSLRDLTGREDVPILIDQEGGRVARMKPPHWPEFPAWCRFSALYDKAPMSAIEAARANAEAIAVTLAESGINVDALPLLDLPRPGADAIIGDRALGAEPLRVAALGRAVLDGLAAGGVLGIVKHMPGHGRAEADSHKELPLVDANEGELEQDLAPFIALAQAPAGMVAHVRYTAWDADRAASVSPTVIGEVIRGRIGFPGLLLSDDIGMGALAGSMAERTRAVLDAGCDLALHCSGLLAESEAVLEAAGEIGEQSRMRLDAALASVAGRRSSRAYEALAAKRDALLAVADDKSAP